MTTRTARSRAMGPPAPVRLDDSQVRPHTGLVSGPEAVNAERCGSHSAQFGWVWSGTVRSGQARRGRVGCGEVGATPTWHIVFTHPSAERWAAQCLAEQGFPVYLPLCTVIRQDRVLRTMTRRVEVPLWPGYVLVQFALTDPWGPVQHTRGVRRLLMASDGNPGIVSNGLVEAVRATEAVRRTLTPPGSLWRPGMPCRLAGGAFAGTDAVVLSVARDTAMVGLVVFGAVREAIVGLALLASRDSA